MAPSLPTWLGLPILLLTFAVPPVAAQGFVPGGGPKKTDCLLEVAAPGTPYPSGSARPKGVTCLDGDACDSDGQVNGVCTFATALCINQADPRLPACRGATVSRLTVKAGAATAALEGAASGLGLPSGASACSAAVPVQVAVGGPDKRGEFTSGRLKAKLSAKTSGNKKDKDEVGFTCLPNQGVPPTLPPVTTTTSLPPTPGTPGAGVVSQITAASVGAGGVVTATFTLTDGAGVPLTPRTSSTSAPGEARVRLTIARIDRDARPIDSTNSTTFTRYRNYIVSGSAPGYDSGGTLAVVDAQAGIYTYTFGTTLPANFDPTLTHTIGAQVEHAFGGQTYVANPLHDFVPAGGPVTTVKQVVTDAECNACHGQLAVHGGGRRATGLCHLCHTDQGVDPDTGNSIEFSVMVHKIHRGKDLPSVQGAVGDKYSIIGFQGTEFVFGERVRFCRGGTRDAAPCTVDADCGTGSTCVDNVGSTIKTAGVAFPQDLRACEVCHAMGATAADYKDRPAAAPCQACHDDVNPGQMAIGGVAPGTDHIPGAQPDGRCLLCHVPGGDEFGIGVDGAHTVPERSAELAGLMGTIMSASGAPGGPVTVQFKVTDAQNNPVDITTGFNAVRFAISGPGTDFGGSTKPVITPTAVGGGASGTLTPQGGGLYTYVTSAGNALPGNATGTWRIGLEARRPVTVGHNCVGGTRNALACTTDADCPDGGACGYDVNEALQNPTFDFSVDGSPVAPRRDVVDPAACQRCHGVFSEGFSVHGNLRNQPEYCVICHNPNVSDFARRVNSFCAVTCGMNALVDTAAAGDDVQLVPQGNACSATACVITVGANGLSETTAAAGDAQRIASGVGAAAADNAPIHLKSLLHRVHTGEELATQPYLVYGFGSAPLNFTAVDFGEVLFPNDRRRCTACHLDGSQLLPLEAGLLPTRQTAVDPSTLAEIVTGSVPPVQDACTSCHDTAAARAHAASNTAGGTEACDVCHAEGRDVAVSAAHMPPP